VDAYKDNNYYVYSSFKDGIDYVYVTKYTSNNSSSRSFTFHKTEIEATIKNNIITFNEMKDWYTVALFFYGLLVLFFGISIFAEEWDINTIYRKCYKTQVTRHKDVDYIYFVLRGKVIKKVPNSEEGGYSDNIENISYAIDHYISDRNFLDDFKGTLMDQRENALNDILD
tara:strand:- start:2241 stop:2750 length:510 start_codon:yes stop_codon:yes gene_type:complete